MVKTLIKIPVIANGDITTPEKAKHVLDVTGADGIMIGRAAQGRPWLFREIEHYLKTGEHLPPPRSWKFTAFCWSTSTIFTLSTARKRGSRSPASTSPGTPRDWLAQRPSARK
jgi:tRNA-dihydrouridine synthase